MKPHPLLLTCFIGLVVPLAGLAQPTITVQPQSQTNVAGSTLTLAVEATGAPPLSYQWRSHATSSSFTNIPFGTEATLVLTNIQPTSRRFAVVVTDSGGLSATSSPLAILTVLAPPAITTQPTNFPSVNVGETVGNRVAALGTAPLYYQWRLNGTNLFRETNSSIVITNFQSSNAGAYTAVVTNSLGAATSMVVTLVVAPIFTKITSVEEARFFRIAGSVACSITAFRADGFVTWTNAPTNATFTVQTAQGLPSQTLTEWVDYLQVPVTNSVTTHRLYDPHPPTNMAFIPAGSFLMGDTLDGTAAQPTHTVFVSAVYLDRTEVTKALWDEVRVWANANGYAFDNAGSGKAPSHPVQTVNWFDAVKWCNARSQKEGRIPAYYTDAALTQVYKTGQAAPYVKWNAGYRLPTEAEWEKAARGVASRHRFPWPNVSTITHSQANYNSSTSYPYDVSPTRGYHPAFATGSEPYTSPVGSFAANGYGLYDMAGNVREWCWDWFGSYPSSVQTDPRGPASGSNRVRRGGAWHRDALVCRAAHRDADYPPSDVMFCVGFRSALPPGQP